MFCHVSVPSMAAGKLGKKAAKAGKGAPAVEKKVCSLVCIIFLRIN